MQLSYDEFPKLLVDAFISAEDKTFFSHHGVDVTGFGAAVLDYVSKIGSGQRARGGSTITPAGRQESARRQMNIR